MRHKGEYEKRNTLYKNTVFQIEDKHHKPENTNMILVKVPDIKKTR